MENHSIINNPIKISVLDIFPTFEELNPKKEEMFAIFQGLNKFFGLKEILSKNKQIEIENNNQSSIIISLIKSNNIIASGYINIKQGEQWITLNYETKNKKINSNLALNLMDCIKLKIFCEIKNKNLINTTFNNININNSALNINTNINYTNRNINKGTNVINQINLKISKRNINNRILLKGSPIKANIERTSSKRSPNKELNDFNNYKISSNEDLINNNLIKSNNFNTYNYMNVNINMNPYTTISKCSIKKIDLNTSNKTRNSKIPKKKNVNGDYSSLRTSNNNFGIKKMNTSTCSLNTVFKNNNNNKKSRLTPDLEIKGLKNTKIGGSPGPNLKLKKKINDNFYEKNDNKEKTNDKTFNCSTKTKNICTKEINRKNNNKNNEENHIYIQKKVNNKQANYSNNILNSVGCHNTKKINKEININNDNKSKTINDNNYNNAFNNTFNTINKQVIKNKLLFTNKQNNNINKNINNNKIIYSNSSNTTKKNNDIEGSINSFNDNDDEEEKNKIKDNNIYIKEKVGIYTNKRINIKKNNASKNISPKYENKENIFLLQNKNQELTLNRNDFPIEKISNENEEDKQKDHNNENFEEENYYEDNNYERIKEDFILLYNDDYTNNIQDDLLKLEIELFIEKMSELISTYHYELEQKRMENELINNEYNSNIYLYKQTNKLIKKLESFKLDFEIKNKKTNTNKKALQKEDKISLIVNKAEIEIYKNIIPENNNKEKVNILKNILFGVLKKEENRNILSENEKINNWINNYLYDKNNEKENNQMNINNVKSNNQINNYNSNYNLDNTYKKKMLISPAYPRNNKYIPSSELAIIK